MSSRCTKHHRDARTCPPRQRRCPRRGTAEIELILSVVLLIGLLMLIATAMRLGAARLEIIRSADFLVFQNVTEGPTPQYDNDPSITPIEGFGAVRPGMPNRMHAIHQAKDVPLLTGSASNQPTARVDASAAVLSPSWNYSSYPFQSIDRATTQDWYERYAADPRYGLEWSLGLAPAWPP